MAFVFHPQDGQNVFAAGKVPESLNKDSPTVLPAGLSVLGVALGLKPDGLFQTQQVDASELRESLGDSASL